MRTAKERQKRSAAHRAVTRRKVDRGSRREGPWLKIKLSDGGERYIGVASVSQNKNRFVPLDFPAPAEPYIRDCSAFRPKTGKVRAQPVYNPQPEYTKEARRAGIHGTVTMAITIGTDGHVHEVKVLNGLGHGEQGR